MRYDFSPFPSCFVRRGNSGRHAKATRQSPEICDRWNESTGSVMRSRRTATGPVMLSAWGESVFSPKPATTLEIEWNSQWLTWNNENDVVGDHQIFISLEERRKSPACLMSDHTYQSELPDGSIGSGPCPWDTKMYTPKQRRRNELSAIESKGRRKSYEFASLAASTKHRGWHVWCREESEPACPLFEHLSLSRCRM